MNTNAAAISGKHWLRWAFGPKIGIPFDRTGLLHVRFEYVHHVGENMARVPVEENGRINLRLKPEQKARLVRAAAPQHTDLTQFVLQPALCEADAVIKQAEQVQLTERDSLRVLDLLEHPPAPNARLRAAAQLLPPSP